MNIVSAIWRVLNQPLPKLRLGRVAVASVLTLVATFGSLVVYTNAAQASAFSCTGYGWIKIPKTSVATSRWCGQTNGDGLYVKSVGGAFTALVGGVYLCNTSLEAEFFDNHGKSVATYYSPVTGGCWQAGGVFTIGVNRTFRTEGYVRLSLLSYGAEKAAVEQNIKGSAPQPTPTPKPASTPTKVITAPAVLTPTSLKSATTVPMPASLVAPLDAPGYAPVATLAPVATPQPVAPAAAATWNETAGGVAHTWTNYSNAGGYEGATIGGGQTVAVACKVGGFRVADGNTWWYRIASSPWNGAYYVSADAFYNNGRTSGSLAGTPYVDGNVPNC